MFLIAVTMISNNEISVFGVDYSSAMRWQFGIVKQWQGRTVMGWQEPGNIPADLQGSRDSTPRTLRGLTILPRHKG